MLAWISPLIKALVIFSIVTLLVVAIAMTRMVIQEKHHRLQTTSRTEKATTKKRFLPPVLLPETYVVHGNGTLKETHIPFRLYSKKIITVSARINGKARECIVDTGCPDILWNSWLHLTDQRTGLQLPIIDAGNHTTLSQEAVLDRIQIGGLELRHMPSYAIASGHSQSGAFPILGNSAFAHTVLTIDYIKREFIIRPSIPNSIPVGVRDRDHTLDFHWVSPNPRGEAGVPCVRGNVMSLPMNVTIDTGWMDNSLGVTGNFYNRLLPQLKANHIKSHKETIGVTLGETEVITISHLSWSVGEIAWASPAVAVDALQPGAQAVLGWGFLRNFRTTIDYPQQKIWFDLIQPTRKHQ
jgi:hypothetical protein